MAFLSVIIPSRNRAHQVQFLNRSIGSISAQTVRDRFQIEVLVGLDPDTEPPELVAFDVPVRFVNAAEFSGCSAVNAAAAEAAGDYLAMLEDDDVWDATHLDISLQALERCAFVSGTELEVDPEGNVVRINDFPTPSGWVMPQAIWENVGPLDTSYRLHHDNEWLGRLAEKQLPRVHLVESTAPIAIHVARQVRPWLANLFDLGGGEVEIVRHNSPLPLIRRLVHQASLMHIIASDGSTHALSDHETSRLIERYGRIPW